MECLESIGLLPDYVQYVSQNRITALVNCAWLEEAAAGVNELKIDPGLKYPSEYLHRSSPDPPSPWRRVSIKILRKRPGIKVQRQCLLRSISHLSNYSELMSYIAQENYKNLWSRAWERYAEHSAGCIYSPASDRSGDELEDYDSTLGSVLSEIYGDFLKPQSTTGVPNVRVDGVLPAYAVLQTALAYFVVQPFMKYSLRELQTFSPCALSVSSSHLTFLCYQLLRLAHACHSRGLAMGIVCDDQVLMTDDGKDASFWIAVTPRIEQQLALLVPSVTATDCSNKTVALSSLESTSNFPPERFDSIEDWCDGWIEGTITNYDYLMFLNKLAGRRAGDPNHHPVLPWVMDFSARDSGYRDLCKSKFRLNKGDEQLDQMYTACLDSGDSSATTNVDMGIVQDATVLSRGRASSTCVPSVAVPHHVSAVLSDITYYTYIARRTPRDILCAHVRPKWVPNEYPASIERLQAWTPDECIPEFFTDPSVFVSIHDDLPDLKVPAWAGSPERFVELHMQALESEHVSQSLHHWIDLTFGYKLRGEAAVEAKNVCLQLVDGHRFAENHGIVQLFTRPHPARLLHGRHCSPPRLPCAVPRASNLPLSTFWSSQNMSTSSSSSGEPEPSSTPVTNEGSAYGVPAGGPIVLPEEFDPLDLLNRAERAWLHRKQARTAECSEKRADHESTVADLVYWDMVGIACIVVKAIFPLEAASIVYNGGDNHRLKSYYRRLCRVVQSKMTDVPKSLVNLVHMLTTLHTYRDSDGLPPLCPGLLLHPLIQLVPFPPYYCALYDLVCLQKRMEFVIATAAHMMGQNAAWLSSTGVDAVTDFCGGVVRECLRAHAAFLAEHGSQLPSTGLELIMPYILRLLRLSDVVETSGGETTTAVIWLQSQQVDCAVQAAWTLFSYISQILGPRKTYLHIIPSLVRLYDSPMVHLRTAKCIKLYHRSFVQQLCSQISLESFLAAGFPLLLARGVAGFKDFEDMQSTVAYASAENLAAAAPAADTGEASAEVDLERDEDSHAEEAEEAAEECCETPYQSPDPDQGEVYPEGDWDSENVLHPASESAGGHFNSDGIEEEESTAKSQLDAGAASVPVDAQEREHSPVAGSEPLGVGDQYNVRHVAVDCMTWLCERLGPVLAVRHVSEALLQTLKDCYSGPNAVDSITRDEIPQSARLFLSNKYVVGDAMSSGVLRCLVNMAAVYGEQFVLIHFFNYVIYVVQAFDNSCSIINLSIKSGTGVPISSIANRSLEAGLLACVTLVAHLITCLSDTKLLEVLEKNVMREVLTPLIRTVLNANHLFPSGVLYRSIVTFRIVDVMVLVSVRIGFDQTRQYMCSALKLFFSGFNVHASSSCTTPPAPAFASSRTEAERPRVRDVAEYVQIKQSSVDRNNFYVGSPVMIGLSPSPSSSELSAWEPLSDDVSDELRHVFSPELAQYSYVRFCKLAGGIFLQNHVLNEDLVSRLAADYDDQVDAAAAAAAAAASVSESSSGKAYGLPGDGGGSTKWFVPRIVEPAAHIPAAEVDGNKLLYVAPNERPEPKLHASDSALEVREELRARSDMIAKSTRHLKGNWLAYCEHEWGLDKCDTAFRFKQIHLQDFRGHTGSVRSMQVLDNENSFVTGSKDKTVKLWSLRNVGDGSARCHCQYTYTGHKRNIISVAYMESVKLIASLDGAVHIWDPFFGVCVRQYDVSRIPEGTTAAARTSGLGASAMQLLFAPSPLLVTATAECTLRLLDVRARRFVQELKTWQYSAASTAGPISGLAVSQNNMYVAAASASGYVSVIDLRTGFPQAGGKAHDGEILQIRSFNEKCFVTSSLDSTVTMWRYEDMKSVCNFKGHSDPVRCFRFNNSTMISATTGNRIGVHPTVGNQTSFYSEKLRADSFKGVLTSMAVLPLNKLLLLGADNGTISLFA